MFRGIIRFWPFEAPLLLELGEDLLELRKRVPAPWAPERGIVPKPIGRVEEPKAPCRNKKDILRHLLL